MRERQNSKVVHCRLSSNHAVFSCGVKVKPTAQPVALTDIHNGKFKCCKNCKRAVAKWIGGK